MSLSRTPDVMPVLSRGKHRSPRKGACFMELASYLAGERWSDHPDCTHPVLARLAREINDHVDDYGRERIAPMIPDVIGLTGDDPRLDAWIAREAARTALPVASAERQGVAAVGVLRCERVLNELEGRPLDHLDPASREALAEVPHAWDWARRFCHMGWGSGRNFQRRSAPTIVHAAVAGIAHASIADPDTVLVELLERTITRTRDWLAADTPVGVDEVQWHELCELTATH
ncbi:MAG TPA: hypothetical protein VFG63_01220 [Nocardioidaceae bacterium]|nr:hypothetical protein [Nocardioidaceae bacterium]